MIPKAGPLHLKRGLLLWAGTLILVLISVTASSAARPTIPDYAYKAAGHRQRDGSGWSIWLYGKDGSQCWGTRTTKGAAGRAESGLCGYSVPKEPWQFAAAGQIGRHPAKATLFFLTRVNVLRLDLRVRLGGRVKNYRIPTKRLTADQASRAKLSRAFRFASAMVIGPPKQPEAVVPYIACGESSSRTAFAGTAARLCPLTE